MFRKWNGACSIYPAFLTVKIFRWDTVITEDDFKFDNLIQHPEQKAPPGEAPPPDAIGLYLTKKERKKMRRLNRKEVQKEEQEKIRLGLLPVPEPKVEQTFLISVVV